MSGFVTELKRRNVIRMAGLYVVAAWLITQVTGTVLPMFEAPAWLPRTIVILLAVGFIPALIFAWVFELTPHGLKLDAEEKPGESIAPQTARRMDRTIIVVLIIALVYFAVDKFVLAPRRETALREMGSESVSAVATDTRGGARRPEIDSDPISPKSVAVLPFVNMSGDPKNEFFSDGITEEILNALAQIADLKVARARTSAFMRSRARIRTCARSARFLPLNANAEVRAATFRSAIWQRVEDAAPMIPSLKIRFWIAAR